MLSPVSAGNVTATYIVYTDSGVKIDIDKKSMPAMKAGSGMWHEGVFENVQISYYPFDLFISKATEWYNYNEAIKRGAFGYNDIFITRVNLSLNDAGFSGYIQLYGVEKMGKLLSAFDIPKDVLVLLAEWCENPETLEIDISFDTPVNNNLNLWENLPSSYKLKIIRNGEKTLLKP